MKDLEKINGKTVDICIIDHDGMNPKIEIIFTDGTWLEIEAEYFNDITLRKND